MLPNDIGSVIVSNHNEVLFTLLGKQDVRFDVEQMIQVWVISAKHISRMYRLAIKRKIYLQYGHLIPAPVDRASACAWL